MINLSRVVPIWKLHGFFSEIEFTTYHILEDILLKNFCYYIVGPTRIVNLAGENNWSLDHPPTHFSRPNSNVLLVKAHLPVSDNLTLNTLNARIGLDNIDAHIKLIHMNPEFKVENEGSIPTFSYLPSLIQTLSVINLADGLVEERISFNRFFENVSGRFSCFDNLTAEQYADYSINTVKDSFIEATKDIKKIKVIKCTALYRGKSRFAVVDVKPSSVLSGGYIFAYKSKTRYINQETLEWDYCDLISLGTFEPVDSLRRGNDHAVSAMKQLYNLLFTHNGLKLFNPLEYEKQLQEIAGLNRKYWDGYKIILSKVSDICSYVEHDSVTDVSSKASKVLTHSALVAKLPEAQTIARLNSQLISNANSIKSYEDSKSRNIARIEETEASIRVYNEDCRYFKQQLYDADETLKSLLTNSSTIHQKLTTLSSELTTKLEQLSTVNDNSLLSWLENLQKSIGLVLTSVQIQDSVTNSSYTIDDLTDNIPLIQSPQINLIEFIINQPIVINVDAGTTGFAECEKRVGGPYRIKLQWNCANNQPTIWIALLNTAACYGCYISESEGYSRIYFHPHTSGKTINLTENPWSNFVNIVQNSWDSGCLGEAAPGLVKGFQNNDIKMLLITALNWLSNAHSKDAWGVQCKYFPTLAEVSMKGERISTEQAPLDTEPQLDSEDDMIEIARNMAENINA